MAAVGVAAGLMSESGSAGLIASADERSFLLDELQFSLGEGPSHDALTMRRPVLIADLASSDGHAWPIYGAGTLEAGVTGVFAFPLHIGAMAFGVLTIYTTGGQAGTGPRCVWVTDHAPRYREDDLLAYVESRAS